MHIRSLIISAIFSIASAAQADVVDWRQGSGNNGQQFTTSSGASSLSVGSGTLTLGLRAVQRSFGNITPTGNVYLANTGFDTTANAINRAWWNFDIFAGLGSDASTDAALANLSGLTLGLSTNGGAVTSFDLLGALRGSIDCHITGCVNGNPVNPDAGVADLVPGNDGPPTQNAARFFNASQNPVFAPWFSGFDYNADATYDFVLQSGNVSTSMQVIVGDGASATVPEPASLGVVGLALACLAVAQRRTRRQSKAV